MSSVQWGNRDYKIPFRPQCRRFIEAKQVKDGRTVRQLMKIFLYRAISGMYRTDANQGAV